MIYQYATFKVWPNLFGREQKILYKQRIVHCSHILLHAVFCVQCERTIIIRELILCVQCKATAPLHYSAHLFQHREVLKVCKVCSVCEVCNMCIVYIVCSIMCSL